MTISKPARTFQDLLVVRKAHEFVLELYALTAAFPKQEAYGLSFQDASRGCASPANIAEGIPSSWQSGLGSVSEHSRGVRRRMPVFSHPRQEPRLR